MEEATMDENRVEGTARNLGGKIQEGFGKVTGNARAQAEGLANQAAGAAQDLYGQAADTARVTASSFEKALRHTIETQSYTSALVALAARSHASAIVSTHVTWAREVIGHDCLVTLHSSDLSMSAKSCSGRP
jgi:uncharacterized protein YjbJ (UPF0337 family)